MKLIGRALGAVAFAYDVISAIAVVGTGIAIVVLGVIDGRASLILIGAVMALLAAAWLFFDVWRDRHGHQPVDD